MKKTKEDDSMNKLLKLTKLMKEEKIKIAPAEERARSFSGRNNKWRSQDPKFPEKQTKSEAVVTGGGMDVDPALKAEYDAWRKDKEDEQTWRRVVSRRKAEAARKAREQANTTPDY